MSRTFAIIGTGAAGDESKKTRRSIAEELDVIARNVDQLMRRRGLAEASLATASDLSPRTVGNFLRPGNRKFGYESSGTIANLIKIALVLGVEPRQLLCDMDDPDERLRSNIEAAFDERHRQAAIESLIFDGICLDSFSGSAVNLPGKLRNADNVLRVLARSPRVSAWDRSEQRWLDKCVRQLEQDGLIRETGEPYPWYRYELTAYGRLALARIEGEKRSAPQ